MVGVFGLWGGCGCLCVGAVCGVGVCGLCVCGVFGLYVEYVVFFCACVGYLFLWGLVCVCVFCVCV